MSMSRLRLVRVLGMFLTVTGISQVAAQMPTYGVGRAPTAQEVKDWDLAIPPNGRGLPPGSGTAALGKPIFIERCASCHGDRGEDAKYRLLVSRPGPLTAADVRENIDPLVGGKALLAIGNYWQYATTLWGYIRRSQPFDEPGSLTADQVYAVTAYLLHVNGIIGEKEIMDAKTLPQIRMPNRDGFLPDARPDVGKTAKVQPRSPERSR
jgi:cytochrome c